MNLRKLEAAAQFLREGVALDEELGNHKEVARVLFNLGLVSVRMENEAARAQGYFEASVARYRQVGYVRFEAYALNNLAMLALHWGDAQQAMTLAQESLRLCQDVEDWLGACYALINLGHSALDLEEADRASEALRVCMGLLRPGQDREVTLWLLEACTRLAGAQGKVAAATRLASAAAALRDAGQLLLPPRAQEYFDNTVHRLVSQLDAATYAHAQAEGAAMTLEQATGCAWSLL